MAEHRLERVVQHADHVVLLDDDGGATHTTPAAALATSALAPPVVPLGRLAGWDPLPLSVRDARRQAAPLRDRLAAWSAPPRRGPTPRRPTGRSTRAGLVVRYGDVVALRGVDLDGAAGEVVALMGRNGSGKSSLLWALHPAGRRQGGIGDGRRARGRPTAACASVALVPADAVRPAVPRHRRRGVRPGRPGVRHAGRAPAARLLERIMPGLAGDQHPRDLSEGQRLGLVLAVQLATAPRVVLLDEPTRGLDHEAKERLTALLRELAAEGRLVVVATHDVEFVARTADRVVVLAEGEVVADGPTADVVVASPAFAPQVAKVLHPDRWLTVDEVADGPGSGTA